MSAAGGTMSSSSVGKSLLKESVLIRVTRSYPDEVRHIEVGRTVIDQFRKPSDVQFHQSALHTTASEQSADITCVGPRKNTESVPAIRFSSRRSVARVLGLALVALSAPESSSSTSSCSSPSLSCSSCRPPGLPSSRPDFVRDHQLLVSIRRAQEHGHKSVNLFASSSCCHQFIRRIESVGQTIFAAVIPETPSAPYGIGVHMNKPRTNSRGEEVGIALSVECPNFLTGREDWVGRRDKGNGTTKPPEKLLQIFGGGQRGFTPEVTSTMRCWAPWHLERAQLLVVGSWKHCGHDISPFATTKP